MYQVDMRGDGLPLLYGQIPALARWSAGQAQATPVFHGSHTLLQGLTLISGCAEQNDEKEEWKKPLWKGHHFRTYYCTYPAMWESGKFPYLPSKQSFVHASTMFLCFYKHKKTKNPSNHQANSPKKKEKTWGGFLKSWPCLLVAPFGGNTITSNGGNQSSSCILMTPLK